MFPKSPKHAEQIEILAVCEKSVATRWRIQQIMVAEMCQWLKLSDA